MDPRPHGMVWPSRSGFLVSTLSWAWTVACQSVPSTQSGRDTSDECFCLHWQCSVATAQSMRQKQPVSGLMIGWLPSPFATTLEYCVRAPYNTATARSKNALKPLIRLKLPPPGRWPHACSLTLSMSNSRFPRSATFRPLAESSGAALPCSIARSTSCIAADSLMLCCQPH